MAMKPSPKFDTSTDEPLFYLTLEATVDKKKKKDHERRMAMTYSLLKRCQLEKGEGKEKGK